jgi:hypothetical protein
MYWFETDDTTEQLGFIYNYYWPQKGKSLTIKQKYVLTHEEFHTWYDYVQIL